MAMQSKPSPDEVVRRGEQIYQERLRDLVEPGNVGKLLAIDIYSGEYEVGDDHLGTVDRLRVRVPGAEVYLLKIGYPATAAIGGRLVPNPPRSAP